jgi:CO/xanthine dehydrogenase Mo-binding subunit
MGDTSLVPYDMGTFGSRTTPTMGPELRTMAVAARQMLIETAAARWNADAATLIGADGKVCDPKTQRKLSYGELTHGENLVKIVSSDEALTPASVWKIAGTPVPKAQGRDFVTGKHVYPSDVVRPGMLFGAVLRPDGFNAKMQSIDTSAAEKLPGVQVVRDGDFTGVVATDQIAAQHAIRAIEAKWDVPAQPSNRELFEVLKKGSGDGSAERPQHVAGSVAQAMDAADVKVEEQYTVQYIAHAPLESRAAVAEWSGDKLTVWTGTQRPFGVQGELAQAFNIPEANVRVIQPDMGSGYGGKHTSEAAVEAARLAKAAGKPVKLEWTRREEFTWAYFRPAGLIEIRAGVRRDGTLLAWEFHNYNSGNAGIGTPYNVPNQIIQYHPVDSPLRQGSYRSLAAAANHFARESAMDSLAHGAGMDPLEFRLKNLSDPRLIAVFKTAAERFGWGSTKSTPERGFGIAGGTDKGGYVATCAEVAVGGGFSAADAEGGYAAFEAVFLECRQQGDDNARTGGADGMAESASAAVDVDFFIWQREIAHDRHNDYGKRLVDFKEVNVAEVPAGTFGEQADGADGRGGKQAGVMSVGGVPGDDGKGLQAAALSFRETHEHERGRAIGNGAGICGGNRAAFLKSRLEGGDFIEPGLQRLLILDNFAFRLAGFHNDWNDLRGEAAVGYGLLRAGERSHGISVLLLSRK